MHERDQGCFPPSVEEKEGPKPGELYFLWHPGTEDVFSGYGLVAREGFKGYLVGLLMVDRPRPADPEWLKEVEATFGEYHLAAMTAAGERGIACQMQIEPESLHCLRRFPGAKAAAIKIALDPLLAEPPKPVFTLRWDEELRLWVSQVASTAYAVPDYEPQRAGRYRPRISPHHLRHLWLEKQRTNKPMTQLIAEALDEYLERRQTR